MDDQSKVETQENLKSVLTKITDEYIREKTTPFKSNSLGQYVRSDVPKMINSLDFINQNQFLVKGSVGQGNWAQVPWISILDKNVTTSRNEDTIWGTCLAKIWSEFT